MFSSDTLKIELNSFVQHPNVVGSTASVLWPFIEYGTVIAVGFEHMYLRVAIRNVGLRALSAGLGRASHCCGGSEYMYVVLHMYLRVAIRNVGLRALSA
jgi:hypothetical protein